MRNAESSFPTICAPYVAGDPGRNAESSFPTIHAPYVAGNPGRNAESSFPTIRVPYVAGNPRRNATIRVPYASRYPISQSHRLTKNTQKMRNCLLTFANNGFIMTTNR